ncbi:unnamed protein product [Clavelina lepadiformis]|uniref:Uncharacterized protein n=1 Tax=Clavelina lepadiformis TaxID=159417 RepID=A0ABP0GZW4_CLALP
MYFTRKQNNLHSRPIILFCRQYFLQEVVIRLYFLKKISAGKVSINFAGYKAFHIQMVFAQGNANKYRYEIQVVGQRWLTKCQSGTLWLTDRDAGTKP